MDPKWQFLHVFWEHRTKILVLMLIVSLDRAAASEGAIRDRLGRHRGGHQQHRNRDIQHDRSSASGDQWSTGDAE